MPGPDLQGLTADERFRVSVEFYRRYEKAVAAWLMRRGWFIFPVYDFSGLGENKAPKLQAASPTQSLVTPDLFVSRGGTSKWVEVKWKTHAEPGIIRSMARKCQPNDALETGVSLRLWRHYEQVQSVSGCEVWITFVHEREREMRGAKLDELRKSLRIYDGQKMGRHGMAFFAWDDLVRLAPLDAVLAELPATVTPPSRTLATTPTAVLATDIRARR